jgi:leader peptidase (prepilin peptidase)/N-methyltransferase
MPSPAARLDGVSFEERTSYSAAPAWTWPDAALTALSMLVVAVFDALADRPGLVMDVIAASFLVPLVLADLRVRRLPDRLTLGGTAALLAVLAAGGAITGDFGPLGRGVVGALLMAAVLFALHVASPAGMGFGDVKLGLLLGVLVGSRSVALVLTTLLVAGAAGAVVGVIQMVRHRRRQVTLPFGPCLVLGAVLALVLSAN